MIHHHAETNLRHHRRTLWSPNRDTSPRLYLSHVPMGISLRLRGDLRKAFGQGEGRAHQKLRVPSPRDNGLSEHHARQEQLRRSKARVSALSHLAANEGALLQIIPQQVRTLRWPGHYSLRGMARQLRRLRTMGARQWLLGQPFDRSHRQRRFVSARQLPLGDGQGTGCFTRRDIRQIDPYGWFARVEI